MKNKFYWLPWQNRSKRCQDIKIWINNCELYFFGLGPNVFFPLVPSVANQTINNIGPIIGITWRSKNHPEVSMSWSLLHDTASWGKKMIKKKIIKIIEKKTLLKSAKINTAPQQKR